MIRLLATSLLLLTSTALLAQPLYRWIEPDGSITFSPNKPTNGQAYELVQSNKDQNTGTIIPTLSPVDPLNQDSLSDEEIVARSQTKKPTPAAEPQGLAYAPRSGTQNQGLADGITRSGSAGGSDVAATTGVQPDVNTAGDKNRVVLSSKKFEQCRELRKRVVSLESQIKTGLTPERMDSTVVYMARYQRSINQYCD